MCALDATDTATSDTVVDLRHVTKYFDQLRRAGLLRRETHRVTALDDVSLTMSRGEFTAYAGPNGAGKSTTFKLLCGMLAPQAGEVRVFGQDPIRGRVDVMRKTGVLFGNRSELWWDHPVRASFEWKKRVWDIPEAIYNRAFEAVRDLLGLREFLDAFARELSLGQRMRADLALTMLHEPELILLDEPTLGLDVLAKRQMIEFLKHINRERGATILVTSHDIDDLTGMARRIVLINQGKIAFDGDQEALLRMTGDRRVLSFRADGAEPTLRGATRVAGEGGLLRYEYDAEKTSIADLLRGMANLPGLRDVQTGRAPIEAVIAELYQRWEA